MINPHHPTQKIFYQEDNVKAILPQSINFTYCSITIYENNKIEILKQRQIIQTEQQKHQPNIIKLREIVNLELTLSYSVKIAENSNNSNKNLKYISAFQPNFIITNILNNQTYAFQLRDQEEKLYKIQKLVSHSCWVYEKLLNKYDIVHQFLNHQRKNHNRNQNKSAFLVLKNKQTFKNYCVKIYKRLKFNDTSSRKSKIQLISHEVMLQNLIRNKHIMRYSKFIEDGEYFYLFYQQKPVKLLSQYLMENDRLISQGKLRSVIKQLLKAISVLSMSQIMHNNLKASSVFIIEKNDGWKLCVGEFQYASKGLIQALELKAYERKQKNILAPQLLQDNELYGESNDFNSDVFSVGLLFYQMLFKKPFHRHQQSSTLTDIIKNQTIDFDEQSFNILSNGCLDLLKKMLEHDPNFRISAKEALSHPYFAQYSSQTSSVNYRSVNTLKSIKVVGQRKDTGKVNGSKQQKERKEYHETLPFNKIIEGGVYRKQRYETDTQVKINKNNLKLIVQNKDQKSSEGLFDAAYIDDSHKRLTVRDIRFMRPALPAVKKN